MEPSSSVDALIIEDLGQQKLPARYLTAILRRTGWRVQLVDLNDDTDALVALAKRATPRLIVSSILFADRLDEILALMTVLRDACPHAHLALAGHLPAFASAELRTACPALDTTGVQTSEVLDDFGSLDNLPFPARDDGVSSYLGYGFATVEASRGCYHTCAFCLPSAFYRAHGAPYRLRSIANLVDEIESLYQQGARLFLFDDEQFLPPKPARAERVAELANQLARRDLHIAFTLKCRADDIDEALFRHLQEIGLLRVYIGIESGDQATLDLYNKRVTAQQNADALAVLDKLGIVADFRTLIFHPWSTLETIGVEIAFLQKVLPHCSTAFDFREVEIYPDTPLADRLRDEGKCSDKAWQMSYPLSDPRAELGRHLHRIAFNQSDAYRDIQDTLAREWFACLLARRFHPSSSDAERVRELKERARRVNSAALNVWQDMLEFANGGEAFDTGQVNARTSAWTMRLNMLRR
jgi:anaerobic magnesium-protoporphyrin IX monomethyl ester cyclase